MPYKDPEAQKAATKRSHQRLWSEKKGYAYEKRQRISAFIDSLKDCPCTDCGESYPACVMDFDHVRGEKLFNVTSMKGRSPSEAAILEEVAKCDVVCANCHRIRTWLPED